MYKIINGVKYKNKYSSIWREYEEWMKFFYLVGEFVNSNQRINFYISYIDTFLPAIFISKGIINNAMNQLKSKLSEISITDLVNIGDVITYLYDSRGDIDIWRKAEILDIFNSEILTEEKYNPYLKLNIELGRDNYINVEIPKTIWKSKISLNNRYKSTAGSKVSFKSGASDFLRRKYGEDMYHYLNSTSINFLNIYARGFSNMFEKLNEEIEFKEENFIYKLEDYIHLSDSNKSYSNCNLVKSDNNKINFKNIPNIFLNDSVILARDKWRGEKNIYISNRMNSDFLSRDLVIYNICDSSINSKLNVNTEFHDFLIENDASIPRGVEIFVY
ncbi:MAG: hypothetical protein KZY51_07790 [Staphylococcaceae bacterium]|uniref:hypothetical protein n=1 Tax=Staphylococcus capitis TaxID=29388 RepID=UPI0034580B39|nr:hypothetical protein [Staphylococcaceae bacterium]MBW4843209.1 hypothetical protein [Staphylococcaceae bacterium]